MNTTVFPPSSEPEMLQLLRNNLFRPQKLSPEDFDTYVQLAELCPDGRLYEDGDSAVFVAPPSLLGGVVFYRFVPRSRRDRPVVVGLFG